MGKKTNKKIRSGPGVSIKGLAGAFPEFPDPRDLPAALEWWRSALSTGFSPAGAPEHLAGLGKMKPDPGQKEILEALCKLTASPLGKRIHFNAAPEIPASALVDESGSRLYISDALGGGLICLDHLTGKQIWQTESGRYGNVSGLVLHDGKLIICDRWRNLLAALSAENGKELWRTEESAGGVKLSEPVSLALAEFEGKSVILLCERANHRISRFSAEGDPLGYSGRRGLYAEELIFKFSDSGVQNAPLFLEFPGSVDLARDIDNEPALFVWDWWNCRLLCLDLNGKTKRQFFLERNPESAARFPGQIKVISGPCGPVILEVDDLEGTLSVRAPEGDILLKFRLRELLFSTSSRAEVFRIAHSCSGDRQFLVTSGGNLVELSKSLFDTSGLLENLHAVRSGCAPLALARWELPGGYLLGDTVVSRTWRDVSETLSPEDMVSTLIRREYVLSGLLERNLARLDSLAADLERCGAAVDSARLRESLTGRVEKLTAEALAELDDKAVLGRIKTDPWYEAWTDVDMALFKSKGRNQQAEITLDAVLDESREHPATIRRAAWEYHTLSLLLARRTSAAQNGQRVIELAELAEKLLVKRMQVIEFLQQNLSYDKLPQRILREELKTIHRGVLNIRALEQVTAVMAAAMTALLDSGADSSLPGLSGQLKRTLQAAGTLPGWDRLSRLVNPLPAERSAAGTEPARLIRKLFNRSESDSRLKKLIENMDSYLKEVEPKTAFSANSLRLIKRQKEIFALKASLLAGKLPTNGRSSPADQRLLERAREIAGEAWAKLENLRKTSYPSGAAR